MQRFSSCVGLLAEASTCLCNGRAFRLLCAEPYLDLKTSGVMLHCVVLCTSPTSCPEAENNQSWTEQGRSKKKQYLDSKLSKHSGENGLQMYMFKCRLRSHCFL